MVLIIAIGVFIFINGKKESFPNVSLNNVFITTVYPGASAEEVEKFVTDKIEKAIESVNGKKKITSTSKEGLSRVIFEVDDEVDIKLSEVLNDIKTEIDAVKKELPSQITDDPTVSQFKFSYQPVISVFVSSKDGSETELMKIVDKVEEDLLKIKHVSEVQKTGYRNMEVWIEVNPNALSEYNLSIKDVVNAIKIDNTSAPAGKIEQEKSEFLIKTESSYRNLRDIKRTIIKANDKGNIIRLSDLAKVSLELEKEQEIYSVNGKKVVQLRVVKKPSGDIIKVCNNVKKFVTDYQKKNESIKIFTADDVSFYVKRRLGVLSSNATVGLFLVFLCLIFFFSFRITFWTVVSIPFAFCAAMIVANSLGLTVNLITMFGLIIVIGMLVDDAILVAENIFFYIEKGMPPMEAAVKGTTEVLGDVIATIMTTIVAFAPLMTISSITGEILSFIPKIVILTLVASLVECLFILPGHIAHLKQGNSPKSKKQNGFMKLQSFYRKMLNFIVRRPVSTMGLVLLLMIFFVWGIKQNFIFVLFPSSVDEINVEIELPISSKLQFSSKIIEKVSKKMTKELKSDAREVIATAGLILDSNGRRRLGSNLGKIRILLNPNSDIDEKEITEKIQKIANQFVLPEKGIAKIAKIRGGPPAGKPVEVKIFGDDYNQVTLASQDALRFLSSLSNINAPSSSYEAGKKEVVLNIQKEKAFAAGVSLLDIGSAVRNSFYGDTVDVAKSLEGANTEDELDIVVKYREEEQSKKNSLAEVPVQNKYGNSLFVSNFVIFKTNISTVAINREEQKKYISVGSELKNPFDKNYNAENINKKFLFYLNGAEFKKKYPDVSVKRSGESEDQKELIMSLARAMFFSILGIYIILLTSFKSYSQPLIVMSIVPFGIIAAVFAILLEGTPVGLLSFLGLVALTGVLVNDSLVIVRFINKMRDTYPIKEAIIEGSARRLRPILLTTLTTVTGILPLAYGNIPPFVWITNTDPFLQPMAKSIFWGLAIGAILVLIIVPALYTIKENIEGYFRRTKQ